jgi:hypothetical protein
MLEIQGIADYKKYSFREEASPKGENQGAEFKQLMMSGQRESGSQGLPEKHADIMNNPVPDSRIEVITYTYFGKKHSAGGFLGRNFDVKL